MNRPTYALLTCLLTASTGCGQKLSPGQPAVEEVPPSAAESAATDSATQPLTGDANATPVANANATGDQNLTVATNANATPAAPATPAANVCGTNSPTIGYAAFAGKVINTSCGGGNCHITSSAAGISLNSFQNAKNGFMAGGLNAINQGSMPKGLPLSTNDKCLLTTWAAGNYQP